MKTRVINTSGEDNKYFGFLPEHGRTFDSNESYDYDGDLRTAIAAGTARYSSRRRIAALDAACARGDICLVELAEECCSSSSA
jgi:hypothetical protein